MTSVELRVLGLVGVPSSAEARVGADPAPRAPESPSGTRVRWNRVAPGPIAALGAVLGRRPDVVVADPTSAAAAARLARWHRAPLVIDARGRAGAAREHPRSLRRAIRVLVAGPSERTAVESLGVESGRVLEVDAASPAADAAVGPVTRVGCLGAALAEARRLARGRDVPLRPAGAYRPIKRAIDGLVGTSMLVVLAPLLLLVALMIRIDSPGPVLFRQRRIGRATSEFTIMKFRTMFVGTPDLASHLVGPGSSRVTRLGRILRRTSIDELPQLWHLITGEMSLVGPRPALHNQYDLIALRQASGIDGLTPGVTGWAQVNGRDDIPLERKVDYDRHYLNHVSPLHDLVILVRTVVVLFSDRGTY